MEPVTLGSCTPEEPRNLGGSKKVEPQCSYGVDSDFGTLRRIYFLDLPRGLGLDADGWKQTYDTLELLPRSRVNPKTMAPA